MKNLLSVKHWKRFVNFGKLDLIRAILSKHRQVDLSCSFDLVYRKTGIRLFDFSKGIVVKIFLERERGTGRNERGENLLDCCARERAGRNFSVEAGVPAPTIIEMGESPTPYLVESWVPGSRFPRCPQLESVWTILATKTLVALVRTSPPKPMLASASQALQSASQLLHEQGERLRKNYPSLHSFMTRYSFLMAPDAPILMAAAHGDYVPANLLDIGAKTACLLDWEAHGSWPFGYDLWTYLSHCAQNNWVQTFRAAFEPWIEECDQEVHTALEEFGAKKKTDLSRCLDDCSAQAALAMIGFQAQNHDSEGFEVHLRRCDCGLADTKVIG